MKKREYKEQERQRHYYFFDYLFWLGEITWENYHKINIRQPKGNDMLMACIVSFIFMPILTIANHFLYDRFVFEVFSTVGKVEPRNAVLLPWYRGCRNVQELRL